MPTVSIIIPTYRHRDYVLATLDSVFAQTFLDYEIIVVNDGSPDDTADLLCPLAKRGRIRYIEQINQGQAAARNRGIAEAQGEFIALLDDDDLWPPDKLEWQVSVLRSTPQAVLSYGFQQTFGDKTHPILGPDAPTGKVYEIFRQSNWICSPGQTLIRTRALKSINGFDPTLWGVDDWDMYIRLALVGEFVFSHRLALHYRCHAYNASHDVWRMYVNATRLRHKHLGVLPRLGTAKTWRKCRHFIASLFFNDIVTAAREFAEQGNHKGSRKMWVKALRINPGALRDANFRRDLLQALKTGN